MAAEGWAIAVDDQDDERPMDAVNAPRQRRDACGFVCSSLSRGTRCGRVASQPHVPLSPRASPTSESDPKSTSYSTFDFALPGGLPCTVTG